MTDDQQNIQNDAPNQGAQGQFHGDVNTGTQQDVSGERAVGIGGDANAPVTTGDQNTVTNIGHSNQSIQSNQYNIGGDAHFQENQPSKPHQLRAPVADFVGREQKMAALRQTLTAGDRAVAICGVRGMGGIGKTELAMVVANQLTEQFPDGQVVVELFGASNPLTPERAVQEAIRAFDREAKLPDDLPSLQALYRQHCSGKRLLVLADDAKDEAQVRPLLPPAGCALLVTSRPHIELEGMQTHALGTLSPTEAKALLLTICPRIGDDAPELAKLCGYLPLALRVSATFLKRRPTRPLAAYLQNLRDEQARLSHLRDPKDLALNVEASLALSYNALPTEAQQAFEQLGVCAGSFTLEAAEAVVEVDGSTVAELLDELYLNSLLEYDADTARYDMHDLARAFALARLNKERPVRLRHAQYYQQVSMQAEKAYLEGKPLEGLALFDQERQQTDAVWAWLLRQVTGQAVPDIVSIQLVIAMANATMYTGALRYNLREQRIPQIEAQVAAARRMGQKQDEGQALSHLGRTYNFLGEHQQAFAYHEQALRIARELGDQHGEGRALSHLGADHQELGDAHTAIAYHEQYLAIARNLGDQHGQGRALGNLGVTYRDLGDARTAMKYCEQYLAIARNLGDRHGEGAALNNLGLTYRDLGDARTAIAYYEQYLAIARELGDRRGEGIATVNIGTAHLDLREYTRALQFSEQARELFRALGAKDGECHAIGDIGVAYAALGDDARAIAYLQKSRELAATIGTSIIVPEDTWILGLIYEERGDVRRAITCMEEALVHYQAINHTTAAKKAAHLARLREHL
jgi:tetratricopeptide (TPR) repeat protein